MLKHIVLWTLKETANGQSKQENAVQLQKRLESLNGKIEGLIALEVGLSINDSASDESDVVLYSEFKDRAALAYYQQHPEHVKMIPFVKSICSERQAIDYIMIAS